MMAALKCRIATMKCRIATMKETPGLKLQGQGDELKEVSQSQTQINRKYNEQTCYLDIQEQILQQHVLHTGN